MMGLGLGFIWMLLFWGIVILMAILLISLLFPASKPQLPESTAKKLSAREILKLRYARGELTTEEYEEMRQTLEQS